MVCFRLGWALSLQSYYRALARDLDVSQGEHVGDVLTDDDWSIPLYLYSADGARNLQPVLLIHGLSANRFSWDSAFYPADTLPCLAVYLARALAGSHAVYTLELRGSGRARYVGSESRPPPFDFDDVVQNDVLAALRELRGRHGKQPVHTVGHSMGGMLSLASLVVNWDVPVASVTTIGSFLRSPTRAGSIYAWTRPLAALVSRVVPRGARLPIGLLHRMQSLLSHVIPSLLQFHFVPGTVPRAAQRRLFSLGFHAVPFSLLHQLGSAASPGGLLSRDGHSYTELLRRRAAGMDPEVAELPPILCLSASGDIQCRPAACAATAEVLGAAQIHYGRRIDPTVSDTTLCLKDMGHFDLLLSTTAHDYVFPDILIHILNNSD